MVKKKRDGACVFFLFFACVMRDRWHVWQRRVMEYTLSPVGEIMLPEDATAKRKANQSMSDIFVEVFNISFE